MGTVKVAKKRKAKNGNGRTGEAARKKLDDLYDALEDVLETYSALVESVSPNDNVTQEQLHAACVLEHIVTTATSARKVFDARMLAHHELKGSFEVGKVAITFPESGGKRVPKWKQEAIDQANALADELGKSFAEEAFIAEVIKRTVPGSIRNKVKLVMSAD